MEHMEHTTEPEAKQWIFSMIRTLNHEELTRCFLTLWAIWFARRKAIHENVFQSPLPTNLFVESMMRDLAVTTTCKTKRPAPAKSTEPAKWVAPPVGYAKINVDAVVRKQVNVGEVAAVCRDENGVYQGSSTMVMLGVADPTVLEALACREALTLASDL
jgi:hypothetical protein